MKFFLLQLVLVFIKYKSCNGFLKFFSTKEKTTEAIGEKVENILRGVPPQLVTKISSDLFSCDSETVFLNRSQLNDNYCDCKDGSDEPGTSACPSVFHCINSGYKIIKIPSSRVDDGVCDCCDGSDEGTVTKCSNICDAVAYNEREALSKLRSDFQKGRKIRNEYIKSIENDLIEKSKLKDDLEIELKNAKSEVDRLQAFREEEEKFEKEDNENKKYEIITKITERLGNEILRMDLIVPLLSNLFDVMKFSEDDLKGTLKFITTGKEEDETEHINNNDDSYGDHEHDLEHDQEQYNDHENDHTQGSDHENQHEDEHRQDNSEQAINHHLEDIHIPHEDCILSQYSNDPRIKLLCSHKQDPESLRDVLITVVSKRQAVKELQYLWGYYIVQGTLEGAREFAQGFIEDKNENKIDETTDNEVQDENSESIQNNDSENTNEEVIENEQNENQNHIQGDRDTCPALLAGISSVCTMASDIQNLLDELVPHNTAEANIARTEHSIAEENYQSVHDKLKDAQQAAVDLVIYGDKLAFLALKGQQFKGIDGKFTYTLNMMESIEQSAEGEGTVSLGKFDKFHDLDGGKIKMSFHDGQYCHAFGPRTAEIEVTCGSENILRDASEPSTCFYTFKFESPAACTSNFAEINGVNI